MSKDLVRDQRGAALAEFVIAIVPFLMLFFCTAQYSVVAVGKILTKHAAFHAARAAIVTCTDPTGATGMADATNAANVAYGPVLKLGQPSVAVTGGACDETNQAMMTVQVTMPLKCGVPLGNLFVCGGTTKTLTASASMPNQGTYANKIWGGQ
jgi:Flp pilus assembly protein TadG